MSIQFEEQERNILRLVDSRGVEKELNDRHIGHYVFLPDSKKQKIADILQMPVYSVAREMHGKFGHRKQGKRIFVQTGKRDGFYLLIYEVMPVRLCKQIIAILDQAITLEDCQESEDNYRRNVELLDRDLEIPTILPKGA